MQEASQQLIKEPKWVSVMPFGESELTLSANSERREPPLPVHTAVNPLVGAASECFAVITQLRTLTSLAKGVSLEPYLLELIKSFQTLAVSLGYGEDSVKLACQALCVAVDESLQQSTWGKKNWSAHQLIKTFTDKDWSMDQFIAMLRRVQETPTPNVDLMELLYLCLVLGFTASPKDKGKTQSLTDGFYQRIRQHQPHSHETLSTESPQAPTTHKKLSIPWKKLCLVAGLALVTAYGCMTYLLKLSVQPVAQQLQTIAHQNGRY